jgi:hypothetical protein
LSGEEKKVKDKLKMLLKADGSYFFMPVQMGMGATTVDFLCCVPVEITPEMVGMVIGAFVGIETKAPGKVPSPRQQLTMQEIKNAYGVAVWGDDAATIFNTVKSKVCK